MRAVKIRKTRGWKIEWHYQCSSEFMFSASFSRTFERRKAQEKFCKAGIWSGEVATLWKMLFLYAKFTRHSLANLCVFSSYRISLQSKNSNITVCFLINVLTTFIILGKERITNGQQRTDKLFCSNVFVFTKKVFIAICIFTKLLLHEINVLFKTKRCLSFYVSSEFDTVLFSLPTLPSSLLAPPLPQCHSTPSPSPRGFYFHTI